MYLISWLNGKFNWFDSKNWPYHIVWMNDSCSNSNYVVTWMNGMFNCFQKVNFNITFLSEWMTRSVDFVVNIIVTLLPEWMTWSNALVVNFVFTLLSEWITCSIVFLMRGAKLVGPLRLTFLATMLYCERTGKRNQKETISKY